MRLPKLGLVVLLSLLSLTSAIGAPRGAPAPAADCAISSCSTFLPLASFNIEPQLISPIDGQQITTLAPVLAWSPRTLGVYQIQLSADAEFSPPTLDINSTKTVKAPAPERIDTLLTANLAPNTTYYWRLGVPTSNGYIYPVTQSFVTPPAETLSLPPPVTLLTPRNNTRLKARSVTLTWQAVPGAVYYRARVYYPNGDRFFSDEVTGTTVDVTDLPPKTTFHWRVRVLNASGRGDYSQDYFFHAIAPLAQRRVGLPPAPLSRSDGRGGSAWARIVLQYRRFPA
jgi:hypothetical protein